MSKISKPIFMKIDTNMENGTKGDISQDPRSFPRPTSINVKGIRSTMNPLILSPQNATLLISKTRPLELRGSIHSLRTALLIKFLN
jgi:hypothetical protein